PRGPQPFEGLLVRRMATALPDDGTVRDEAQAGERREDVLGRAGDVARTIEVLDPQQPAACVRAGVEPARHRGDQGARMERAGGRGREATDVAIRVSASAA